MLVGFPPLILRSILLEAERAFDLPFFDPTRGGDPLLWQHLFWLFGHPEVYIIFLPAAGMVSTFLPVFAGRPLAGYRAVVVSVIAMGFILSGSGCIKCTPSAFGRWHSRPSVSRPARLSW